MIKKSIRLCVAAMALIGVSFSHPAQAREHAPFQYVSDETYQTIIHPKTPMQCLTSAAYYEARGTSDEERVLVARVILSRTVSGVFPKSICDVVHEKHISRRGHVFCQFTWHCTKPKLGKIRVDVYNKIVGSAAKAVFLHNTKGAYPALFFNSTHRYDLKYYRPVLRTKYFTFLQFKVKPKAPLIS